MWSKPESNHLLFGVWRDSFGPLILSDRILAILSLPQATRRA